MGSNIWGTAVGPGIASLATPDSQANEALFIEALNNITLDMEDTMGIRGWLGFGNWFKDGDDGSAIGSIVTEGELTLHPIPTPDDVRTIMGDLTQNVIHVANYISHNLSSAKWLHANPNKNITSIIWLSNSEAAQVSRLFTEQGWVVDMSYIPEASRHFFTFTPAKQSA